MVDKLMFGTDWYMILMDKLGYRKWYEDTIKALEEVSKALEGQFSALPVPPVALINPIKFYRLDKIVDKLKDNLTAAIGQLDGGDKAKMLSDLERRHAGARRRLRPGAHDQDADRGQAGPAALHRTGGLAVIVSPGPEVERRELLAAAFHNYPLDDALVAMRGPVFELARRRPR